jgi:two-component system, cell cycle sensor histidine kinase and response regulator CckA
VPTEMDDHGIREGEPPRDLAEAEAALRESEERYRALVETVSDWVWEVDENTAYTFVSPKIRDLLGYEPGEILGKTPFDLMPPDEALRVKEIFGPRAARREPIPAIENANLHKDGHLVVLETSGAPFFDAKGRFRGYRGVDRDVTARKQAEKAIRRNEEHLRQVRKFEEIGRLAGGMAHHLNNLMTVVTGYCELLLTRIPSADPLRPDIEKVHRAGERAADLTKGLLAFSRHNILQPRIVEINRFLSDLSTALHDLSGPTVRLLFLPGKDAGEIRVDPDHLRRTMTQLVANARDAMPGGGEIRVATAAVARIEPIEGIEPAPGRFVLLSVQDNGGGMDAETRDRIFEPFHSLKTGSEGLGLPSVYGFVKQSGGEIFVDSKPGRGTTFRIYFPCIDRTTDPGAGSGNPAAWKPNAG